jgi:hypothetical protein
MISRIDIDMVRWLVKGGCEVANTKLSFPPTRFVNAAFGLSAWRTLLFVWRPQGVPGFLESIHHLLHESPTWGAGPYPCRLAQVGLVGE